jgi:hypothetical protein
MNWHVAMKGMLELTGRGNRQSWKWEILYKSCKQSQEKAPLSKACPEAVEGGSWGNSRDRYL